ncbi:hypothetical protein EVAR_23915_1 [Eumeta japonica]|uniref:Uncharacterized protein n=1 Tax=Eumeta variegata TaxID=151549 RepID=A0A4C1V2F8_EUMVA|nr:hypothetical protein EVAR_23915_1 [Eumeta japonica]
MMSIEVATSRVRIMKDVGAARCPSPFTKAISFSILTILCATNCLKGRGPHRSYASSIFESVQKNLLFILIWYCSDKVFPNLEPNTAAFSSNRGIETNFNGLTCALAAASVMCACPYAAAA